MSWLAVRSSFSATCLFVVIVCANLLTQVENESVFGIGTRIHGDQLLLRDVLQTPPLSLTKEPVIKFNYAISEPITYIEIESDKIVYAVVNFSYENDIIDGTISSISGQQADGEQRKPEAFEVIIQIYGLNSTMSDSNSSYKYNDYQQVNGILKPKKQIQQQTLNLMQENLNDLDGELDNYYDDDHDDDMNNENGNDDDDIDGDDIDYGEDDFNSELDKIIEQGQRQNGDFLVYETEQTSATTVDVPSNQSITFYYIDIYYITYVKFTIYEHYSDNPLDNDYVPVVVEYEHISPTTLKAVVTDHRTRSLNVQMQMYGFHPTQLPVDYKPFLSNGQITASSALAPATTRPISSLRQLKILMNAQQSTNLQQEQHPQQQQQQPQLNELGHQISPSNNNSHVNCLQQVLSSSSQQSQSNVGIRTGIFTPHWAIFNLILMIFVTIVFA